jgi:hypothetical protein
MEILIMGLFRIVSLDMAIIALEQEEVVAAMTEMIINMIVW